MVPVAIVTVESEALIRRPNLTLATVDRYLSGMADIPSFEYCILTGISLPDGKRYGPKQAPKKLTKAQRYAARGLKPHGYKR